MTLKVASIYEKMVQILYVFKINKIYAMNIFILSVLFMINIYGYLNLSFSFPEVQFYA